jgi:hypothetical protein
MRKGGASCGVHQQKATPARRGLGDMQVFVFNE